MDTQDPPNQPRYQLTRGLTGLDNKKDDRKTGSTRCYLGSSQYWVDRPACEGHYALI